MGGVLSTNDLDEGKGAETLESRFSTVEPKQSELTLSQAFAFPLSRPVLNGANPGRPGPWFLASLQAELHGVGGDDEVESFTIQHLLMALPINYVYDWH